jgi:hypothetical protein
MALLALCAEIRLIIFDFALPCNERFDFDFNLNWDNKKCCDPLPGILYVSKQVRSEAAPIFYANNSFRIWTNLHRPAFDDMVRGIRSLSGTDFERITRLQIDLNVVEDGIDEEKGGRTSLLTITMNLQNNVLSGEVDHGGGLTRSLRKHCLDIVETLGEVLSVRGRSVEVAKLRRCRV